MTNMQLLEHLGQVAPIDPELLERTAARLADPGVSDAPAAAVRPIAAAPSRARRIRVIRRASVAAAMVAVLVVAGLALSPGSPSGPPAAGASELGKLALAADTQPAQSPPGPGQYQYTSSIEAYTSTTVDGPGKSYMVQVPENRQIWIGPDGSGRLVESYGQAIFLSPQDRADWVAAGSPDLSTAPSDESFGPGGLSPGPTDLSKLPTDPEALGELISSRHIEGGPPGPAEDFVQIGDLLRETAAPPALRAALFQVAAALPGVQELGAVTDHSGRTGVGVAIESGGARHELIFNPADSSLMGEQDVVTDAASQHEPVGTLADWVVYLSSSVVNSTVPPAQ
jgi:RNA polymerase sigma-70 factor (ECF subfamily)